MQDIAFPDNYTPPVSSSDNYLRFAQEWKYYFRILSSPLIGFEYWSKAPSDEKAKPIRSAHKIADKDLIHPEVKNGKTSYAKEFYAFKVFAYDSSARDTGKIKILSTTTKSIKDDIRYFMQNADFPKADKYDIVIERSGSGLSTKYQVTRLDSSDCSPQLQEANAKTKVNLEALLENKDPFDIGMDPVFSESRVSIADVPFA